MVNSLIAGKLVQLIDSSLEILRSNKSKAKPMKLTLVKHKITKLEISETTMRTSATDQLFERDDWGLFLSDLVRNQISILPIFKEIVEIIVKDYSEIFKNIGPSANKRSQTKFWLGNFVTIILREKLNNSLDRKRQTELISGLENELNLGPIQHKINSYIVGVYVESNSIQIDRNTIVRKLKPNDLEYEYYPFTSFPSPRAQMELPRAVIEIEMRTKSEKEIIEKLQRTLQIFRLYRLGSVRSLWNDRMKFSVIWPFGIGSSEYQSRFSETQKYVVKESEIEEFKNFCKALEPFIVKKKEETILSIAIERYNNALLEPVDLQRKIMIAIMGLESLYSMPKERGENRYKLSLRTTKLLSFLGFKPTEVRKNIEKAYSIRNKVSHGMPISKKEACKIEELNTILDYLRLSLIIFLSLSKITKNEFVHLVDSALIDVNSSLKLNNELQEIAERISIIKV